MNEMHINKKNLFYNLKQIKKLSNKKICAVVKANAYGHGINCIVKLLKGKVDFFAVANLKEALAVRKIDSTTPILILFECNDYILASKNNISVSVYSIEQAQKISKLHFDIPLKVHIKINVGMNRIGFKNFKHIKKGLSYLNHCCLEGVYTHYSTVKSFPSLYKKQKKVFSKYIKFFKKIKSDIISHTGGSLSFNDNNSQMLRTGLFLYGYGDKCLKPIMSIYSSVMQTFKLNKNEYSGYDKEFKPSEKSYLATVPIGYQDGIKKQFIGKVITALGYYIKIVAVCMDCTMIEVPRSVEYNDFLCVFNNANVVPNLSIYEVLIGFNSFRGVRKIV